MAWLREGGDKGHKGVHFESGVWTNAIKQILDDKVKPELVRIIQGQKSIDWTYSNEDAVKLVYDKAVRRFERLHGMSIYGDSFDDRETFFRDCIVNDPDIQKLKERFDLWCAIWFWHGDWLNEDVPTPDKFYSPTPEILERTKQLVKDLKFFHWELEFADVFVSGKGGFDAVLGNPPWEISKPKSHEFFTLFDPIYRTRGKQDALAEQKNLFTKDIRVERSWLLYTANFDALSTWCSKVVRAFGDPNEARQGRINQDSISFGKKNNTDIHTTWRKQRENHRGFADNAHPFRYQGSADINTYKLFLEMGYTVCRKGGRLGFIVPSGLYSDKGSTELRNLLIKQCRWEWIFGFENKKKIFQIHSSYKFCPIIFEKGSTTSFIQTAFMHHDVSDWETPFSFVIPYEIEQLKRFSPKSMAVLEIQSARDLGILKKIYSNSVFLGNVETDSWGIQYATEFHMTGDSKLFPPRDWWDERGYKQNEYGYWMPSEGDKPELIYRDEKIGADGDIGLPIYNAKMIYLFDFSAKMWVSGKGRGAKWDPITYPKFFGPEYLMPSTQYKLVHPKNKLLKLCFKDISTAVHHRTMLCALIPDFPAVHDAPLLLVDTPQKSLLLQSILGSFPLDMLARQKIGYLHLTYHILEDFPLIKLSLVKRYDSSLIKWIIQLSCPHEIFSPIWMKLLHEKEHPWRSLWAITSHERLRIRCILDAIMAELYGLSYNDFAWILRDCGHPKEKIPELSKSFDPKGFWRVGKKDDPELRHTVLSLKALADLKSMGLNAFCVLNDGEGWMIPETLTFASNPDGTIAFDTPEGKTMPVRERLGPRFLDWQLAGTPEESWKECEMHARNILGDKEFERMMADLKSGGEYRPQDERIGMAETVIGGLSATVVPCVADVLNKAAKKKEETEKKEQAQKTLGEW